MNVSDYTNVSPSTPEARELVSSVRSMGETEAYSFVLELLGVNLAVGLDVATKVVRNRKLLRNLLDHGLATANASSVRFWLESFVPRLGLREVVNLLRKRLDDDPASVEKAVYFLSSIVKNSPADKTRVLELQSFLARRLASR